MPKMLESAVDAMRMRVAEKAECAWDGLRARNRRDQREDGDGAITLW
jgi:hypothetical protein